LAWKDYGIVLLLGDKLRVSLCSQALQDYGIVLLLGDMLMLKVLINRGLLYFERRDYRNALYDLLLASQISPTEKSIHHTVGLCYHKSVQLHV